MSCSVLDDPRRHLPLGGVRNARDLGGYRTRAGRSVRWGMVYRSGAIGEATPEDRTLLAARGLRSVCDLRSGPERVAAPDAWPQQAGITVWEQPEQEAVGDSRELLANSLVSAERTREVMIEAYRRMPFIQTAAFGALFLGLARDPLPLLFHCSAGKDRSGGAAALLLLLLGVDRETVVADYLLSNHARDALCRDYVEDPRHAAAREHASRPWLPLLDADRRYLEAMLEAVFTRYDTVEQYFDAELGVFAGRAGGALRPPAGMNRRRAATRIHPGRTAWTE